MRYFVTLPVSRLDSTMIQSKKCFIILELRSDPLCIHVLARLLCLFVTGVFIGAITYVTKMTQMDLYFKVHSSDITDPGEPPEMCHW